jgi:hypothetical protein
MKNRKRRTLLTGIKSITKPRSSERLAAGLALHLSRFYLEHRALVRVPDSCVSLYATPAS